MRSFAERQAEQASTRPSFAINIPDLRQTVTDILSQFGRFGFFDVYTRHDITHIDEMLRSLDWIIPPESRSALTPADWFLIVCGVFLHDIGLLVTLDEYARRSNSTFRQFVTTRLFSGDAGKDYQERLKGLNGDQQEKFLYEEFVRENHGRRARAWIDGTFNPDLGITEEASKLINRVLAPLDPMVRADLGILVESHNLDDLKDTKKYPPIKPYDNHPEDIANLQYCAVIVRTADLLQITRDRAPTALFQLISPKNPLSQVEWIKQGAVRMVRAMAARDSDSNVDLKLPSGSIEIFATFRDQRGYFGLSALLEYAERQIRTSFDLMQATRVQEGVEHKFPWRRIERKNINAEGFIKRPFRFEIDQFKILDLLTGHTLYNDSLVVARELVQNSLDAIRLFSFQQRENATVSGWVGRIAIVWNPGERILEISDNGTGMSQETIERHLLKVGSSKYQESQFKKDYPGFFPISRFGIGVLSAFMVADEVEILTTEVEDTITRSIALESVHGDYLIKLLPKKTDPDARELGRNGTRVRLKIRPSAKVENLLGALRNYILIPRCNVTFQEVGQNLLTIGYDSAAAAVTAILAQAGLGERAGSKSVRVIEKFKDGIEIAYAQQWSEIYNEWSLLSVAQVAATLPSGHSLQPSLTCVHGIAVEYVTAGFRGPVICSVADATGARAPRTNVARSALEENQDSETLCNVAYEVFVSAVRDETQRLQAEQGYTLTRATNEAVYLTSLLIPDAQRQARYPDNLRRKVESLPFFLIEESNNGKRQPLNLNDLRSLTEFWTIDGGTIRSAEGLLAQFSSEVTLQSAIKNLSGGTFVLPSPLLGNVSSLSRIQSFLFDEFEVSEISVEEEMKQIKFRWTAIGDTPIWIDLSKQAERKNAADPRLQKAVANLLQTQVFNRFGARPIDTRLFVGRSSARMVGLEHFGAVISYRSIFLHPAQGISAFLSEILESGATGSASLGIFVTILSTLIRSTRISSNKDAIRKFAAECIGIIKIHFNLPAIVKLDEFETTLCDSNLAVYDPFVWSARSDALYEL
jgi:molecular chaperone HtpG